MREKVFDPLTNLLWYVEQRPTAEFWDDKWEAASQAVFSNPPRHRATVQITRKYVALGSRVLEGGCGLGDVVYALDRAGYRAEGVDYAPKVVSAIQSHWPHLAIRQGDVRSLNVEDGRYDGYWSIGVIEHFANGFASISSEMRRVLRLGGYLFLSFPSFNEFRKARASMGSYRMATAKPEENSGFFQYALDPHIVLAHFQSLGFKMMESRGIGSLQCLAEDLKVAASFARFLDCFPSRVSTVASMAMDLLLGRYAGHSCLLVLRKET